MSEEAEEAAEAEVARAHRRIARTFMSAAISSVFSPRRWKRKRSKFDEIPMSIDGVIVSATPFGESE